MVTASYSISVAFRSSLLEFVSRESVIYGKLVQQFVWQSQLQIAAELDSKGRLVKQFVYGSKVNVPDYMIAGGRTYSIITDQLGSPRLVVDAISGKIAQEVEYDEFGNITKDTEPGFTPFGFAGGLYDRDTKLLRFGARDYDPEVGRWTSKDPILFDGGSANLYGYNIGDPVNNFDPDGLSARDVKLIQKITNQFISNMTAAGRRTSPGWYNNLLKATGIKPSYMACGEQAEELRVVLNAAQSAGKFDDAWTFKVDSIEIGGVGVSIPLHQWVAAFSSNKKDPVMVLDAHRPVIKVGP